MPTELEDFDLDEMDELEDNDDNEEQEEKPPPSDRVAVKRTDAQRMRQAVKENKRLKAELNKSRREQAIKTAGIDLDTPQGRFFAEHYDSNDADPEKIRKAATEAGVPLLQAVSDTPASPAEQQATDERQRLATGGAPDDGSGAPTPDPKDEAVKVGRGVLAAGGSEEDAIAASIASQAQAALKGDERAIRKPAWEQ